MKAWEYYISRDIDLIYDVLEYILEVINFAFISGDYIELYKVLEGKQRSLGLESAKGNLLGAVKVLPPGAKVRVGY